MMKTLLALVKIQPDMTSLRRCLLAAKALQNDGYPTAWKIVHHRSLDDETSIAVGCHYSSSKADLLCPPVASGSVPWPESVVSSECSPAGQPACEGYSTRNW